jgi:DNA repair/transcription protein MET18/MMS19
MMQNAIGIHNPCSKLARLSMLWFFQLLVNKFGATKEVLTNDSRSLLGIMLDLVNSSISKTEEQAIRIFQLLAYFTSATLASFDPAMKPLVQSMIDGVANEKYGRKVARSFRILLGPSEILNKENFCTIRSLRNSRLFAMSVEPLISLWSSSVTSDIKENCLIALAGVLYYVDPSFLVENEESTGLLPLILEGTNVQNDEWAKAAFIKTIRDLIPLIPSRIEEHLDSVINRMTDRTHNTLDSPSDGSVRCRELALEVLAALTKHVNETSLVKRKFNLMSELDIAVDDPSRDVRAKAVETKMAWFNIGLPTVGGR